MRRSVAALLTMLLTSCQADSPAGGETVEVRAIEREETVYSAFPRRDDGLSVLDVAVNGHVCAGRALPVPPDGTFRLEYEAMVLDRQGRRLDVRLPERIQDARFSPDGGALAVIDRADELVLVNLRDGGARRLDSGVFPGFAFSNDGRMMAYAKGDAPMLDAHLIDLRTGSIRRLTHIQRPTWGFAFDPGDRTLAFVYSPLGFPSIYTLAIDGGRPAAMTNVGVTSGAGVALAPFPDGRKPPIWVHGLLVFESSKGAHAVGRDGTVVWDRPGASRVFRAGDDAVHYRLDGVDYEVRLRRSP